MPRAKSGVHEMRVQNNDMVYILVGRLPFVAWRGHRFDEVKRLALLHRLEGQEAHNHQYTAKTRMFTFITGMLTIYDNAGRTYSAHHSDLIRV
jgi:hypothetical protein